MVLNQLFWLNFATRSNCPGKEMSVCSNFSLKLSFYWVRHISLTSLTIVVRKDYADQSTMTIHFFLSKQLPSSGLSVCSNFSFERGFLVSQAHLPELASSCSKKDHQFTTMIHSNLWNRSFERPRVGRIKGESKDRAQIWNYNAWKKCAEAKSELL